MRQLNSRYTVVVCTVVVLSVQCLVGAAHGQMCFRGRPTPQCSSFFITEFGLGAGIGGDVSGLNASAATELGWMRNITEKYAIGATGIMTYEAQDSEIRGGLKLRGRRWLTNNTSINVSGGALLFGWTEDEFPSFTGHIDLNYKDFIAPYLAVDVLRENSGSEAHWSTGVRLGSYVGSGLTAVATAVAVAGIWALIAEGN